MLEFELAPDDLRALVKRPGMARTARAAPLTILWHDTADATLASAAVTLSEQRGRWRVEALCPGADASWPPATPAPIVSEATSLAALSDMLPDGLGPIAALSGRRHEFTIAPALDGAGPVRLTILDGHLRGVAAERPACRVIVQGNPASIQAVALDIAAALRLSVPRAGLAAAAAAVARGTEPAPRHQGAPAIPAGLRLTDTVSLLIGQLLDTMLFWSEAAAAGATPVPVHQMRVATRRLRSALQVVRHVAACPDLSPLGPAVRDVASRLGSARDWDVFLDGTAARVADAFPGDQRVRALLAAARRRRAEAYAALRAYLTGAEFRVLTVRLACAAALRPWDHDAAPDPRLQQDTALFAAQALDQRMKRVKKAGRGIQDLPIEALHELRKDCKRLRYTAEFFLPLFPGKPARRFVKQLAALQEELGALNDGAAAAGLMAHLGRAERSYAAGLVEGFVAAGAGASRAQIVDAWRQFRKADPFWA